MSRPHIDFGPAAGDYARYRPGFPDEFFAHVLRYDIGAPGQRMVDIGTGTGTLARGFALRGCEAVGIDPSPEMLAQAQTLSAEENARVHFVRGAAEATGLVANRFDFVSAGQCWHWFDRRRSAVEVNRILRPGGRMLIAYFTYLSDPGTLGAATERLILRHHPTWPLAGSDGRAPFLPEDLRAGKLEHVDTFEFDLKVPMTQEAWRGRMRACNGVLMMSRAAAAAFEEDLERLLACEYPYFLYVPHRVFGVVGEKIG